jgi:glutathione S-transferase
MAIKFYMTPGSCSTGIHILLEHLELPFEVYPVNLPAGEHRLPAYLAINPKGTIPSLQLDSGEVLTEWLAIAVWLARAHPRGGLLPEDALGQAQAIGLADHAVSTLHGLGYTRIFTPEAWLPPGLPEDQRATCITALQAQGRERVAQGFAQLEARLPEAGFACGPRLGLADAAIFYTTFWADKTGLPLPPRCKAHYGLMRAQPVVAQVLAEEGYR